MAERIPRPLIGVTGPNEGGWPAWISSRWALSRAGARAVRITPARPVDAARLDGLVIGGGADVSEPLSGELEPAPAPSRVHWPRRALDLLLAPPVLLVRFVFAKKRHGSDPARDAMELKLLEYARQHDLPVLGICRGSQLMNLAEGGTLLRDVNSLYEERVQLYTVLPRREVAIADGSRLREILGSSRILVNSLHFHAVRQAGSGMRIVAREATGVPQAIEHTGRRFWIGVQWHPEYLPQHESHQRIFGELAEAARAKSPSANTRHSA